MLKLAFYLHKAIPSLCNKHQNSFLRSVYLLDVYVNANFAPAAECVVIAHKCACHKSNDVEYNVRVHTQEQVYIQLDTCIEFYKKTYEV